MFYIDFTSPEGHTYRIDLATHPIKYRCSICGEETIISFDDEDWCLSCYEKRKEQEKMAHSRVVIIPPRVQKR